MESVPKLDLSGAEESQTSVESAPSSSKTKEKQNKYPTIDSLQRRNLFIITEL